MARIAITPQSYGPVTPSDTSRLEPPASGIFVGGAGDVVVKGADGTSATFVCGAGQIIPGTIAFVMATGTDATNIVAFYE